MPNYGDVNVSLTRAVQEVARKATIDIRFIRHALEEMDSDGFDHSEVLMCLRKGKAYGPEYRGGELRANVVHRGLHIRVVVGSLGGPSTDWSHLKALTVVTVMRIE